MAILRGIVSCATSIDNGRRVGFGLAQPGRRPVYLAAPDASQGSGLGFLVRNAASTGDVVEIEVDPVELRLGAPEGVVTAIRTVGCGGVELPLRRAA